MCARRKRPAAAGRLARARGEVSGGAGSAREARAGGRRAWPLSRVPAAPAVSGRGRLGPAAPGLALPETRAP